MTPRPACHYRSILRPGQHRRIAADAEPDDSQVILIEHRRTCTPLKGNQTSSRRCRTLSPTNGLAAWPSLDSAPRRLPPPVALSMPSARQELDGFFPRLGHGLTRTAQVTRQVGTPDTWKPTYVDRHHHAPRAADGSSAVRCCAKAPRTRARPPAAPGCGSAVRHNLRLRI